MKKRLLIIFLSILSFSLTAQEKLIKMDDSEFSVKIIEITQKTVEYELYDYPDEKPLKIGIEQIKKIIYKSGRVIDFEAERKKAKQELELTQKIQKENEEKAVAAAKIQKENEEKVIVAAKLQKENEEKAVAAAKLQKENEEKVKLAAKQNEPATKPIEVVKTNPQTKPSAPVARTQPVNKQKSNFGAGKILPLVVSLGGGALAMAAKNGYATALKEYNTKLRGFDPDGDGTIRTDAANGSYLAAYNSIQAKQASTQSRMKIGLGIGAIGLVAEVVALAIKPKKSRASIQASGNNLALNYKF